MDYRQHPEWKSLLQAIIQEPEDDLPRLVAADWLDNFGEENACHRATFIRMQCENGHEISDKNFHLQEGDASAYLLNHGESWVDEVAMALGATKQDRRMVNYGCVGKQGSITWSWRRGFVEQVRIPMDAMVAYGPDLLSFSPVTRVDIWNRQPTSRLEDEEFGFARGSQFVDGRFFLPPTIWNRMNGKVWATYWKTYPTVELAMDDLSAASIGFCRDEISRKRKGRRFPHSINYYVPV